MDARRILPPRLSGSPAERTPCPCNKPGLATNVTSPHHRSHQPASTLPSPQALGHSIYQPTPGPSRRHSFSTSITYGAIGETEGGPPHPLHPVHCPNTYITPPKAPSSSGYLVTCGTSFHLARPTTDQRRQPTNSNRSAGKPDRDTGAPTACDGSMGDVEDAK